MLRTLPGKGVRRIEASEKAHFFRVDVAEWDGIIADFERSIGEPAHDAAPLPWARTRRGGARPTVEAPFGQALARIAAARPGDRRADRGSRQVHRHPSVPRRLSGPLLQRRHGRAEPGRGRGRPGAHRQDSLCHDLRRICHAPRLRFRRHRPGAFRAQREDRRRAAGPHHRLRRHASGDRGSGADADDPGARGHRPLRCDRNRRSDRGDRRLSRDRFTCGCCAARCRSSSIPATASRSARRGCCAKAAMSASSRPG